MELTIKLTADATPEQAQRLVETIQHFYNLGDVLNIRMPAEAVQRLGAIAYSGTPGPITVGDFAADVAAAEAALQLQEHADATPDPATIGFGANAPEMTAPPPPPVAAPTGAFGTLSAEDAATLARVELDINGLPWDNRIHASTKAKIQSGAWRAKKGVDAALVQRVEAELHSIMGTAPGVPPTPPAAAQAPAAAAVAPPPPPPAAAAPPPPPAADPGAVPTTFAELMQWVTPHMAAGRLSPMQVANSAKENGLVDAEGNGQVALLQNRPDLVRYVFSNIKRFLSAAG